MISVEEYQEKANRFAWFADQPDKRLIVYYGFNEESDELLSDKRNPEELTSLLWGNDVNPSIRADLSERKTSEVGDVLYYINAAGVLTEVPLSQMIMRGVEIFTGLPSSNSSPSFRDLDEVMVNRMKSNVPTDYNPSYLGMQLFNLSPFHNFLPDEATDWALNPDGPLHLKEDGRYVLERVLRNFGAYISEKTSEIFSEKRFVTAAGLALGALSAVAQNRFNSSLAKAAQRNIAKLQRREANNTLRVGQDDERSRPAYENRPKLSGFDVTAGNLIFAHRPN